jgi:hypothetical protein
MLEIASKLVAKEKKRRQLMLEENQDDDQDWWGAQLLMLADCFACRILKRQPRLLQETFATLVF